MDHSQPFRPNSASRVKLMFHVRRDVEDGDRFPVDQLKPYGLVEVAFFGHNDSPVLGNNYTPPLENMEA